MNFQRSSGILLHPTSLPGRCGIGDFGEAAYRFVDFLAESGQRLWQVLPLGPTGYGDSPYQSLSAFAGNPLLIDLQGLADNGLLSTDYLNHIPDFPQGHVDFGKAIEFKTAALNEAFERFEGDEDYADFLQHTSSWLDDYALYRSIKAMHEGAEWLKWDKYLKSRHPDAFHYWAHDHTYEMDCEKFKQYVFFKQWNKLKSYAHKQGIKLIGDIPIFAAHDSADVWASPKLFYLYEDGHPALVSGVPPDYFSETGQLWGNPIYRWDLMRNDGHSWWVDRIKWSLALTDIVRLDHFRGFDMYRAVPGGELTAVNGRWEKGPGADFFKAIHESLGAPSIIAEDLGFITPEVYYLRDTFNFPGMCVLQFAFDSPPPEIKPNTIVYTGTHDNDTTVGWFHSDKCDRDTVLRFLGTDGSEIHWDLISLAMRSEAHTVITPLQDIIGLGSEARMNTPASESGNWAWRFSWEQITPDISAGSSR